MLAATLLTFGNMYDVISPDMLPGPKCVNGCATWSSLNATHSWWEHGAPPADAGAFCAQLANSPGINSCASCLPHSWRNWSVPGGINGSGCFCEGLSNVWDDCVSRHNTPEQINVQIAAPDTVVIGFVTFEKVAPTAPPEALVGRVSGQLEPVSAGEGAVTHTFVAQGGQAPSWDPGLRWPKRTYYMHFVTLRGLEPRGAYYYTVRSGGDGAVWSREYKFRAGYAGGDGGETKIAIFGDMGVYTWNNMGNLLADAEAKAIDLIVHMGDHAYNMGIFDDKRGDGYMVAFEKVLSQVPWLPIMGNHEFYDGANKLNRYLNQTDGSAVAFPADHPLVKGATTTATSAIGRLLSTGMHHGAGTHGGSVPSGTSRWYSTDFGLVHLVNIEFNMYNADDDCGQTCRDAQLKWLEADLAAANANRAAVPWIVAFSHFPLYCSNCPSAGREPPHGAERSTWKQAGVSAVGEAWWASEACEYTGHDRSCTDWGPGGPPKRQADSPTNLDMVPDVEPLLMKYGVDVYAAGHIHDYEWIYPTYNATPVQTNFVNPRAPVHLITGNGGPTNPTFFNQTGSRPKAYSFLHGSEFSYTRLVAHNATHLTWTQISNDDSRNLHELTVVQNKHGAFPIPSRE